ncbi:MAG TPA: GNAT family N-acetyltransferase [Micropepsaceae bacterium]|jgi:ribosomal protein S18 acetylase RimI-like enzyme|nr:GNAT family N-acetyltransferase [Micropepsaceae bacterium]
MTVSAQAPIRRATPADVPALARLFAAAFARDPLFDWLARAGTKRQFALQRFFGWVLERRTLPHGETWMSADGAAAAAWIPPYAQSGSRWVEDLLVLPVILRLTGLARLPRGAAMASAMERAHPQAPYFYLAFIGVVPRMQGAGLGSSLLRHTLARADGAGVSAYLENSNPRNLKLYERAGFSVTNEVKARRDAPPVYAMWRPAKTGQGSSTMSQ